MTRFINIFIGFKNKNPELVHSQNYWTTYIWAVLKHQLISCQEVVFREQLHVLADILDVLYRVNLTTRRPLLVV